MSDTKESMPAQPPTRELPAMTDRALLEDLARTVKAGFAKVDDSIFDLGERVVRVEIRQKDLEERMGRNSQRVREPSQHDLEAKAEIAQERTAREALAKKVDSIETKTDGVAQALAKNNDATDAIKKKIVDGVESFWKRHPKLETALVGLILAAVGVAYTALTHGGHLP